jgi:hypothetical protein
MFLCHDRPPLPFAPQSGTPRAIDMESSDEWKQR